MDTDNKKVIATSNTSSKDEVDVLLDEIRANKERFSKTTGDAVASLENELDKEEIGVDLVEKELDAFTHEKEEEMEGAVIDLLAADNEDGD